MTQNYDLKLNIKQLFPDVINFLIQNYLFQGDYEHCVSALGLLKNIL